MIAGWVINLHGSCLILIVVTRLVFTLTGIDNTTSFSYRCMFFLRDKGKTPGLEIPSKGLTFFLTLLGVMRIGGIHKFPPSFSLSVQLLTLFDPLKPTKNSGWCVHFSIPY